MKLKTALEITHLVRDFALIGASFWLGFTLCELGYPQSCEPFGELLICSKEK